MQTFKLLVYFSRSIFKKPRKCIGGLQVGSKYWPFLCYIYPSMKIIFVFLQESSFNALVVNKISASSNIMSHLHVYNPPPLPPAKQQYKSVKYQHSHSFGLSNSFIFIFCVIQTKDGQGQTWSKHYSTNKDHGQQSSHGEALGLHSVGAVGTGLVPVPDHTGVDRGAHDDVYKFPSSFLPSFS